MLRRWVYYSTFRLSLRPPKDEDAAFIRNVRNCSSCGAASQLTRPVPRSLFVSTDCEWAGVGSVGTVRYVVWWCLGRDSCRLPNLPNLRKSVFVLDKSV